ncbi:MAG: rod shape-determining protein RodA [Lentisphaerae bacterium]|nr:rod shape-determining protein RodA [Lentisphaerota bacterium]
MTRIFKSFRVLKQLNWPMTGAVIVLTILGILFIYSACFVSADLPVRTLYKRQIVWAVAGSLFYLVFAAYDYRRLGRLCWGVYLASIVLLVAVLLVGPRVSGARRWLLVLGVGIQPSELAKIGTVLVLASVLGRPGGNRRRAAGLLGLFLLVAVPMVLVLKEPDLGTALVFVPVALAMMFVGGVSRRVLGSLLLIGVFAVGLLLAVLLLPGAMGKDEDTGIRLIQKTGISEYQLNRIVAFVQPHRDPLGVGWNKTQSEIAVGSGGAWGKGFRNGTQNILGFLPRSVAPTDFIFSVIAEEMGFFGSLVVLFLFAAVIVSGLRTALAAPDRLGRLLCVGVVAIVFTHTFVNMAMTVGMLPITGLPLPLLSYGGSFMIVTMSCLGIVQSVYIRSRPVRHATY